MFSRLNHFLLNLPLSSFPFSKQRIKNISLTARIEVGFSLSSVWKSLYLLPKVKEVKSSVSGQECHFYNDIDAHGHSSTKGWISLPIIHCNGSESGHIHFSSATFSVPHVTEICRAMLGPLLSHSCALFPFIWTKFYSKVSILMGCDTTSVGDCCPMTRDSVVVSTS